MLKQRLITAAILIPIFLAILFYSSPIAFLIFTGFVMICASVEWTYLMRVNHFWQRLAYVFVMISAMFGILFVPTPLIFTLTFFWWLAALVMVLVYPRGTRFWSSKLVTGLMGMLVLIPCWVAVNFLRNENDGIYVLLFIFVLIWGADSTAYFVGKKWGVTKLAPLVSPGKSLQGVGGALAFAVILTVVMAALSRPPFVIMICAVALALITVLFSILGDLFESMLKRQAGLKDSSQILPGHGGILDRIDSLTAAAPIYAFGGVLLSIYFS